MEEHFKCDTCKDVLTVSDKVVHLQCKCFSEFENNIEKLLSKINVPVKEQALLQNIAAACFEVFGSGIYVSGNIEKLSQGGRLRDFKAKRGADWVTLFPEE